MFVKLNIALRKYGVPLFAALNVYYIRHEYIQLYNITPKTITVLLSKGLGTHSALR